MTDRESISQSAAASHGEPNGYAGNGRSDSDPTPGHRLDPDGEPRPLPGVPMAFLGAVGMWQDLERAAALASFRQRTSEDRPDAAGSPPPDSTTVPPTDSEPRISGASNRRRPDEPEPRSV